MWKMQILPQNKQLQYCLKQKQKYNCCVTSAIYWERCKKHNKIYIGNTTESLSKKISKQKWHFGLAEHFNIEHDFTWELDFTILEKDIKIPEELPFKEHLWICRFQILKPDGLNVYLKCTNCCGDDMQ